MGGCTSISVSATYNIYMVTLRRKNSCVKLSIGTNTFVPYIYISVFSAQWVTNLNQDLNTIRLKLLKQGLKQITKKHNLDNTTTMIYIKVPEYGSPLLQAIGFRNINYTQGNIEMEAVLNDVLVNI